MMSLHNGSRGKTDNYFAVGNSSVDWPRRQQQQSRGRSRNRDRSVGSTSRKYGNKSCERSAGSFSKAFYDDIDLSHRCGSNSVSRGRSDSRSNSPRRVAPTDGGIVDCLPRSSSRGLSRNCDRSVGSMSRKSRGKSGEKSKGSLSKAFYGPIDLNFKRSSSIMSRGRTRSRSKSPKAGGTTDNGIVNFLPRRLSRGRSINGDRSVGSASRRSRSKSGERSTGSMSQTLYDIIDLSREGYSNIMPRSHTRSKSPAILAPTEGVFQYTFDATQRVAGSQDGNRMPLENIGRFKLQLSRRSSQGGGPAERKHQDAKSKPSEKMSHFRHKPERRRSQSLDSIERRHEEAHFTSSENSSDSMHHVSRCRSQSPMTRAFSDRHGRRHNDIRIKSYKSMSDSRHNAIGGRRKCFETEVFPSSPSRRHSVTMNKNITPSESPRNFRRHRSGSPNTRSHPPRSTTNQDEVMIQRLPSQRQKQPVSKSTRPSNRSGRFQVHSSPLRQLKTCREDDDNASSDWPISPFPSDLVTCHVRRASFTSELTCSVSSLMTDPSSLKSTSFNDRCDGTLKRTNSVPNNCDENGYCIYHRGFRLYRKNAHGRFVKIRDSCSVCMANESLGLGNEPSKTNWDDTESYSKQTEKETVEKHRSSNAIAHLDHARDYLGFSSQSPKVMQPCRDKARRVPTFISFHDESETSSSDSGEGPVQWSTLLDKVKSSSCHQHEHSGETATKSTYRSSFMSGSSDSKSHYVYTHEYERQKSVSSWPQRESKHSTNNIIMQALKRNQY
ncbi:hypothetical protein ACHAWX_006613 [Stephanocyclus meneghinianus]